MWGEPEAMPVLKRAPAPPPPPTASGESPYLREVRFGARSAPEYVAKFSPRRDSA